jgi:4-alpha-glucanotransferase
LPTLRGWWIGNDIELRREHGLIGAEEAERQARERGERRWQLVDALRASQCLPDAEMPAIEAALRDPLPKLPVALMAAAHRYVARTPSLLAVVRLADLAGDVLPANLPGTVDSYPNWRLKSSVAIERLGGTSLFRSITEAMARERPRA